MYKKGEKLMVDYEYPGIKQIIPFTGIMHAVVRLENTTMRVPVVALALCEDGNAYPLLFDELSGVTLPYLYESAGSVEYSMGSRPTF